MIFISTRKRLDNEDELGSTSYWDIPIVNQVEQGEPADHRELGLADVKDFVAGKSILILVHGFNNEFPDIIRAYDMIEAQIQTHLGDWYDAVVGFSWPGGDSPIDWYAPKRRAGVVGPRLAQFLRAVGDEADSIDLMSHSLGARVVLSALNLLPANSIRGNFMTAAAVDNEVLEPGQKYFSAVQTGASESVVLHTKHDFVLKSAYRLAEWDNPLGLYGPENPAVVIEHLPNVTVGNCKNVVHGHGEYKTSDEVFQFINDWLAGNIETQFVTV